jgi:hypothetical protein
VNLLVNQTPTPVTIYVSRPALGDIIKELNDEPTLYGRELEVDLAVEGEIQAGQTWREHVYTAEESAERRGIQERVWRIGLGTSSPEDDAADLSATWFREHDEA